MYIDIRQNLKDAVISTCSSSLVKCNLLLSKLDLSLQSSEFLLVFLFFFSYDNLWHWLCSDGSSVLQLREDRFKWRQ